MDTDPKDIMEGKVIYTIDDFVKDFHVFTDQLSEKQVDHTVEDKKRNFKKLFMFVLLSALGKKPPLMARVLNFPEDKIIEGQDLFGREIELLDVIWKMRYLDIMKDLGIVSDSMVLTVLNKQIQDYLKSLFPEEYTHDNTAKHEQND